MAEAVWQRPDEPKSNPLLCFAEKEAEGWVERGGGEAKNKASVSQKKTRRRGDDQRSNALLNTSEDEEVNVDRKIGGEARIK
jgi:hypothetical protein